jgi:hypothetical protein
VLLAALYTCLALPSQTILTFSIGGMISCTLVPQDGGDNVVAPSSSSYA